MPARIDGKTQAGVQPNVPPRYLGFDRQLHRGFRKEVIGLTDIAGSAGGDHILPGVRATFRTRYDVVQAFGNSSAVLTAIAISGEHGCTSQGHSPQVRNPDKTAKFHYRWDLDGRPLGVPQLAVRFNHVGFVVDDQDHCPPRRHDGQGFESGVQYQRFGQTGPPVESAVRLLGGRWQSS